MINELYAQIEKMKRRKSQGVQYYSGNVGKGKNEFVMLVKPECLINDNYIHIMNIILNICKKFNVYIYGYNVFSGEEAKTHFFIKNEYYMLNKGANYGMMHLPYNYQIKIKERYPQSIVMGAYGFLELSKRDYTAQTLEEITETVLSDKIGSGTYILPLVYKEKQYAIINAFHPAQMNHFHEADHITVAFLCATDTDFNVLSNDCIGSYAPEKATEGSIRHYLYQKQDALGICINHLYNGVHLSPSPLEGLFGFWRYFENEPNVARETRIFKELKDLGLHEEKIVSLSENPLIKNNGQVVDLFSLCEAKNMDVIIEIINRLIG